MPSSSDDRSSLSALVVEHLPTALMIVDPAGKVIGWNQAIEQLTGRSAQEMLGKRAWTGFFPKRTAVPWEETLESGQSVEESFRFGSQSVHCRAIALPEPHEGALVFLTPEQGAAAAQPDSSALLQALKALSQGELSYGLPADSSAEEQSAYELLRSQLKQQVAQSSAWMRQLAGGKSPAPADPSLYPQDYSPLAQAQQSLAQSFEQSLAELESVKEQAQAAQASLEQAQQKAEQGQAALAELAQALEPWAEGQIPDFSPGSVPASMRPLAMVLYAVIEQQKGFFEAVESAHGSHLAGTSDAQMQKDAFQGHWRQAAEKYNQTAGHYVNLLRAMLDIITHYSAGNFEPQMIQLQGTQARATQKLNHMRSQFQGLVQQVQLVIEAALCGNLSMRADPSEFQGGFRDIVDGLNHTLEAYAQPLQLVNETLQRLAEGDLRARVDGQFQGDYAIFGQRVNAMASAFHEALNRVAQAADQLSAASGEIASTSQSVAQGASQQASSLQDATRRMEQVAQMTQQNAGNTQQANQVANETQTLAKKGAESMLQMLESMVRIRGGAEATAVIIRDINEIAFQTNLLALNAAVEAARAGDAGRGFAVVAEEVRNLAQRAKEAAKKTETLITESVRLTDSGQQITKQVNQNLQTIVAQSTKVTELVGQIASASREQTRDINLTNDGLIKMDQVTQQNAAAAQESASAAQELAAGAQDLRSTVSRFVLSGPVSPSPRAPTKALSPARPAPAPQPKAPAAPPPPPPPAAANLDEDFLSF